MILVWKVYGGKLKAHLSLNFLSFFFEEYGTLIYILEENRVPPNSNYIIKKQLPRIVEYIQ